MKQPHLAAAFLASLLLIAAVAASLAYAGSLESQYIHALAPMRFPQKYLGSALQDEAFRHPDLLPLYGSSELQIPDAYHVNKIFRLYPTGFAAFLVGNTATQPLIYLLRLTSAGTDLRGKKVVIFLSPQFFTEEQYGSVRYAFNFSRMQAYEFAFSTDVSFSLKQQVARRMLDYPDTLTSDPILEKTLELLADGSPPNALFYYAALPLGKLKVLMFQLQDHWETLNFIWGQNGLNPRMPHRAARLNWQKLLVKAEQNYEAHSNNNPFGFDNLQWDQFGSSWTDARGSLTDPGFLSTLRESRGWTDLDLLLQMLREMKAQPLILGIPFDGAFGDYLGLSAGARQVYYRMLREAVRPYGVPLEEFEEHEDDKVFFYNPGAHLSSKGWIFFSNVINAFYHGTSLAAGPNGFVP
jgi:D-alanine transfer protein